MIRQELWCHECSRYVVFEMDEDLSGDLTVICPNCGHEHYRVVVNGEITEVRWASSGGTFIITGNYTSTTSWTATVTNTFITASWHNTANLTFSSSPIMVTATATP